MKIRLNRGLTIVVPGDPEQSISDARPVRSLGFVVGDELATPPELCTEQGATVEPGQTLFRDSRHPEIRFTSPVAGQVTAVHRGSRRRLLSVVIDADRGAGEVRFESCPPSTLSSLDPRDVRSRLLESGLWTAIRARPFNRIPPPADVPAAILVTAIDTNPLACDPATVIASRSDDFNAGVKILGTLAERVCVCKAPSLALDAAALRNVEMCDFSGPHPAGLPGTHVAHLVPATETRPVWHVGYQDVIAVGELFARGTVTGERVVALGGGGTLQPRLLRTVLGAPVGELLADEIVPGSRIILGSLLAGREPEPATAYLSRYETQLTVLGPAAHGRREDSWLAALAAKLLGNSPAMLPLEKFERLWPLPQPVLPLLRALLTEDAERAVELGCLDLAEEDLALCSYACPGKLDYGAALRATLSQLEERD